MVLLSVAVSRTRRTRAVLISLTEAAFVPVLLLPPPRWGRAPVFLAAPLLDARHLLLIPIAPAIVATPVNKPSSRLLADAILPSSARDRREPVRPALGLQAPLATVVVAAHLEHLRVGSHLRRRAMDAAQELVRRHVRVVEVLSHFLVSSRKT
jgi:hypothetical protein